jgi:hypothetical protein
MQKNSKPRLVFFRFIGRNLPQYILIHLQEQVKCLSEFFDVVIINENCDYKLICEKYQPEITVFESGVYAGPREIKNTSAYPEIPKVGFCNADAYCVTRSVFLSDMERWDISTYFCLSVSMPDYTQTISDSLFVWPNFIDSEIYKDYEEHKIIPILLTGSQAAHYPWRKRIGKILSQNYPVMTSPHFGWFNEQLTKRMIHGESYARMINASLIAPTCGTIARELVRKHLEIPACKTCLITEKTPIIEAAGFLDMQNCVFVDSANVLDKVEFLFQNPDVLERITQAGFDLVHSQHTIKHRNQLYQWFKLHKNLGPGEKIVQISPFEPLKVVNANSPQPAPIRSNGLDRQLLQEGDKKLWSGNYKDAEQYYIRCLNYHFMPEAVLRLSLCHLYQGNASQASTLLADLIERSIKIHGSIDPDPVEWSYFIISLICQGMLDEAIKRAHQFPSLRHDELDRTLALVTALYEPVKKIGAAPKGQIKYRKSIHQLPELNDNEWMAKCKMMLGACGQHKFLDRLKNKSDSLLYQPYVDSRSEQKIVIKPSSSYENQIVFPLLSKPFHVRLNRFFMRKKDFAINRMRGFIQNNRYFSCISDKNKIKKELALIVEKLAREEEIRTVLIIGASKTARCTQAVIEGTSKNPVTPTLYFTNIASRSFRKISINSTNNSCTLEYDGFLLKRIKKMDNIKFFGLVIYDGENFTDKVEFDDIFGADFIVINGLDKSDQYYFLERLRAEHDYSLLSYEMTHQGGYAVFMKNILQPTRGIVSQQFINNNVKCFTNSQPVYGSKP